MQNIGEKLKRLRENSGFTRREVAEKLSAYGIDISDKTLYGYESGRSSANADMFLALCQIYNCTNILGVFSDKSEDILFTNEEWKVMEKYRFISKYSPDGIEAVNYILNREHKIAEQIKDGILPTNVEFNEMPDATTRIIQYFQSVSAGTGQVIFDDVYSERITIPDIPEYRRVAYAVKVSGYSMEPLYKDGDMLLIEPTCSIDVGEIGIFNVEGLAYVKKLGEKELISLNAGCGNVTLTDDSRCMGRVVDRFASD